MPRSYSFDHFQVPAAEPRSRSLRRQDKQRVAKSRHAQVPHEDGIHYGKSHAQTEEILKAHAEERARAPAEPVRETKAEAPPAAQPHQVKPKLNLNTTPIGALPMTEELPPRGHFQDLLDEAERQFEAIQGGLGDVTKAATRLATLPLEVMRLAARRLRLVHG
jgi:hypothetical protein